MVVRYRVSYKMFINYHPHSLRWMHLIPNSEGCIICLDKSNPKECTVSEPQLEILQLDSHCGYIYLVFLRISYSRTSYNRTVRSSPNLGRNGLMPRILYKEYGPLVHYVVILFIWRSNVYYWLHVADAILFLYHLVHRNCLYIPS